MSCAGKRVSGKLSASELHPQQASFLIGLFIN